MEQKIPTFPNCDIYGIHRSSNPNPTSDDVKLNYNALHQQICIHFKVDYLVGTSLNKVKDKLNRKLTGPYWLFYLTKLSKLQRDQQLLQALKGNCTLALDKRELSQ